MVREAGSLLEQAGLLRVPVPVPGYAAFSVAQRLGTCEILSVGLR